MSHPKFQEAWPTSLHSQMFCFVTKWSWDMGHPNFHEALATSLIGVVFIYLCSYYYALCTHLWNVTWDVRNSCLPFTSDQNEIYTYHRSVSGVSARRFRLNDIFLNFSNILGSTLYFNFLAFSLVYLLREGFRWGGWGYDDRFVRMYITLG